MNIVVCIKQVPDSATIRMDRQRMTVIRDDVESIINPLDSVALEVSLKLTETVGGMVTAITMGPPQSEEALREALAAGADKGILLTDKAFSGADTLATSHVLATAISKLDFFPDLIVCGKQTIDSDTGHVGPQIAEELEIPQVFGVNEIQVKNGILIVKRVSDGFLETLEVQPPVLLTVTQDLCQARDLALGSLELAFAEGDLVRWGIKDLDLSENEVGLKGSATRVWKLRPPPPGERGQVVSGTPQHLVDALISKLEELSILDEVDEIDRGL